MKSLHALRRTLNWTVLTPALALLVAAGGCAPTTAGAGGGAAPGSEIRVEVENNLIPPTSLSIYATTDTGVRRLVGVAQPSRTVMLGFDPAGSSGRFIFEAVTTSGNSIRSTPITLSAGETVRWDLNANLVNVASD